MLRPVLMLAGLLAAQAPGTDSAVMQQQSGSHITHGILATGSETFIMSTEGKVVWTYPKGTRDGWVLPNGNVLLDLTRSTEYPSGAIVEVNKEGKTLFEYKGTQSEVDCVQSLPGGRIMLTESGPKPRMLEIDHTGKILVEFPLQCQTSDHHMQTRMARKLPNGHYLVPHLIDMAVKEYSADGKVVWEVHTPNWPFTAIRLKNGNTLITCTRGNMVIEVDAAGKTVWQVSNEDLPGAPYKDACGAQRLPNGNTVLESYGAGGVDDIKLFEVSPDKKIVWTLRTGKPHGLHEFQILENDGKPLKGRQYR
jgi:hypothetical protein